MSAPPLSPQMLALLVCPVCHGRLSPEEAHLRCQQCARTYPIQDGIPILLPERARNE